MEENMFKLEKISTTKTERKMARVINISALLKEYLTI
jgi:hypothetical protein